MTDRSLGPREALDRWLASRRPELSESSLSSYYYRLKLFVEWAEGNGIQDVAELDGWLLDSYETTRRGEGVAPTSLQNEMKTLRGWVEYLERLEVVEEGLAEKVHIPDVPDEEKSNEELLEAEEAVRLIHFYRTTPAVYGGRHHAWLELLWHTSARPGALRGLDVRDFYPDDDMVWLAHRPKTDTPLKNGYRKKEEAERYVGFPPQTTAAVQAYLDHHREDVHDEHGRQPLLTTQRGRPSRGYLRTWSYLMTQPCVYGDCPHGRDPDTCEYREKKKASKCPSARSPHRIRTGTITWQRDLGFPPEVVAERSNASISTIEEYYDKADERQRLEERRRPFIERMDLDENEDEDS